MDDPFGTDVPEVVQPPKRKALFSAKAKAIAAQEDKPIDFFSRSKDVLPQYLAEEERRRQRRLMKLERKRSSASADTKEITPPEEKRRRVSSQTKTQNGYSSDESHSPETGISNRDRRQSSHSTPGSQHSRKDSSSRIPYSPTSLSAQYNKEITSGKATSPRAGRSTGCIALSDSENESPTKTLPVRNQARQPINLIDSDDDVVPQHQTSIEPIVEEENQFSDEEYPELVAAAKERARLKVEEAAKSAKAFKSQNQAAKTTDDLDDIFELGPGPGDADPVVEILITSMIEGTAALRVKRKISQNLAPVRIAWCKKQVSDGHPRGSEFQDLVFLTWKRHRLFDVSTCNGLGLKVNEMGSLSSTGDGLGEDGRVHLEAWTPDSFETFQRRQAAKEKKEQQGDDDEAEHHQPAVPKTRLIFKSRDLPDFKLMVKPSTTVERMVEAFRESTGIPDDKTVTMYFDGDKLEYSDKVEDTELGDMDTVEVHIK